MNTFVISDPHFGHENIIKYCNRPFNSVEEMNATLIKNWNDTVGDDDTIICNGDFMFGKRDASIFSILKGRKILVRGNHDPKATTSLGWEAIHDIFDFTHVLGETKRKIVMCHYPMFSWNKKFHNSIHLFGHVHNIPQDQPNIPNSFNICVEYTDYRPVNLNDFQPQIDYQQAYGPMGTK